jgi:phospholipase C
VQAKCGQVDGGFESSPLLASDARGEELRNRWRSERGRDPVPEWAEHRPDDGIVRYGVAPNMNTPDPDPGEEYPHINTQLFGILDEENRGQLDAERSFNEPREGQAPSMDGFVADYISMLTVELGRQPTVEEYAQIMTGYTREQMPVLSGIARGFATFDHWFCDVPTCTYPNRSFFHAGQSTGYVVNMSPPGCFPKTNDAETLFDRLDAAGLTWKVYCDPPSHYSLTGVIHAPRLAGKFATNFFSTRQFFEDAETGELPTYSFIEPQIIGWNHNDMHPPFGGMLDLLAEKFGAPDAAGVTFDPPSSLIAGEELLARIYNAIRNSSSPTGSNHLNTTLLVTFDEHGGTYDHVAPPAAVPPDGNGQPGPDGIHVQPLRHPDTDAGDLRMDPRAQRHQPRAPRDLTAGHDARALQPRRPAHRP